MKSIRHWNSKTKILLAVLGVVVLAGVGVLIWGISTGRISSSADTSTIPTGTVMGRITDDKGNPVVDVTVNLMSFRAWNSELIGKYPSKAQTDANGNYKITPVPASPYRYAVTVTNCGSTKTSPTRMSAKVLPAGGTINIDLTGVRNIPWVAGRTLWQNGTLRPNIGIYLYGKTEWDKYIDAETPGSPTFNTTGNPTPLPSPLTQTKTDGSANYRINCILIEEKEYVIATATPKNYLESPTVNDAVSFKAVISGTKIDLIYPTQ